ncbi:immunoglobulin-like domain-containing protein [Melittangium boletus]|uniref:immunoglobulin-like domain-containing protein n=1 Tax=Melittangium boletus TaxID=83453 RepID=UPI003DA22826
MVLPRSSPSWRTLARHTVLLGALTACGPTEEVTEPSPTSALTTTAQSLLPYPSQVSAPVSVPASQAGAMSLMPAVAMGNGVSFRVWMEFSDSAPPAIYGQRVRTSDGVALDTAPLLISTGNGAVSLYPAVASDGANFLVVWEEGLPFVFGRRVRASDGALLDAAPRNYGSFPNSYLANGSPSVTFDGTNYLLTWVGFHDPSEDFVRRVMGRRVRPSDGEPVELPFIVGSDLSRSHAASTGGTSLVAWGANGVKAVRLNAAGQVLDASPLALSPASSQKVRVAAQGGEFLVLWSDNGLRARRVRASDGALLGSAVLVDAALINTGQTPFDVSFDGAHYRLVWFGSRDGAPRLLTARMSPGGVVDAGTEQRLADVQSVDYDSGVGVAASGPGRFAVVGTRVPSGAPNVFSQSVQPFSCAPDVTPPIITCPATQTYECVYSGQRVMEDYAFGDNCDIDYTSSSPHYIGEAHTRTYSVSATDTSGNTTYCHTQWHVVDTKKPKITLYGPSPMTLPYGTPYQEPGYSGDDTCDGFGPGVDSQIQVTGTINPYSPGLQARHYQLTDRAGNTFEIYRFVTVLSP